MAQPTPITLPHFAPAQPSLAGIRFLGDRRAEVALRIDDPIEKARREALAEAEAAYAALRASARALHDREIIEREREYNERTAAALTQRLAAGIVEIETRLAAEVARVLARFLAGAVRERAIGELADTVKALLGRKGGVSVRVAGPDALVDALRKQLDAGDGPMAFVSEEGAADVTVTLNDTIVRTAIAEWVQRIGAAAGEDGRG